MDLQLLDFVSFFGYFFFLSFIGWYVGKGGKTKRVNMWSV